MLEAHLGKQKVVAYSGMYPVETKRDKRNQAAQTVQTSHFPQVAKISVVQHTTQRLSCLMAQHCTSETRVTEMSAPRLGLS